VCVCVCARTCLQSSHIWSVRQECVKSVISVLVVGSCSLFDHLVYTQLLNQWLQYLRLFTSLYVLCSGVLTQLDFLKMYLYLKATATHESLAFALFPWRPCWLHGPERWMNVATWWSCFMSAAVSDSSSVAAMQLVQPGQTRCVCVCVCVALCLW